MHVHADILFLTHKGAPFLFARSVRTIGWNANEWFFNYNGLPHPQMHRNVDGGYIGGPIIKDKLFFFASYQAQRVSDQLLASSIVEVSG